MREPYITYTPPPPSIVPGMDLRDWFAGQALIGLMSMIPHLRNIETTDGQDMDEAKFASGAYALADAMLAERAAAKAAGEVRR